MDDLENPYATPRATGSVPRVVTARQVAPRPKVSRFLTACLFVNVISWPLGALLDEIRSHLEDGGMFIVADVVLFLALMCLVWVCVGWPVSSLATLVYTASADRHTRWWLPKSIVAAVMFCCWTLGAIGLFAWAIATSGGDF